MSDPLHYFHSASGPVALALPFDYSQAIQDWASLRSAMLRQVPLEFSPDEWAYLVSFLHPDNLLQPFLSNFGTALEKAPTRISRLYRPRGPIAIWLPNNVSLLGPLGLILLSLCGQPIRMKLGSSAQDLASAFLSYAKAKLPSGALRDYLGSQVTTDRFSRNDPRQAELSQQAQVRLVFGSDQAAAAIDQLPHPLESQGFAFVDRQSEAWLEPAALSEQVLDTLIKVFAIYGQAGCTSPRRVILLDATMAEARQLRDQLLNRWPKRIQTKPAMHSASATLMALHWARALGWDAQATQNNGAMLACGDYGLPSIQAPMALSIQPASKLQALAGLPANIQTLGHALTQPEHPDWLHLLANSQVRRFVPLAQMHHFTSFWDGEEFWRHCFTPMEVRQ
ncbi:MAG: hypothetical protein HQL47_07565 [Gammaproteobacteria bacterium]|nr:hypothetical protein [Gammaproteobacteria bacterium]